MAINDLDKLAELIKQERHVLLSLWRQLVRQLPSARRLDIPTLNDHIPVAGTASTQLINKVPDDLVVYADAGLLRRVFQNLIANAIKHTPHGEIIIGARELGDQGAVECWVNDNGSGIPEVLLEKIFDVGETTPASAGGTGLGLAIVKTFIEAHRGQVTVESKEGVGSTFRFLLPTKANGSGLTR